MKKAYSLLFAVFLFFSGYAQVTNQWNHYYAHGGASGYFDDGNFIWAATSDNLISFDKNSGSTDSYPLPAELKQCSGNGGINKMSKDAAGNLWMATGNGLYMFDGFSFTAYNPPNALTPTLYVIDLKFDSSGYLWMTTYGAGLVEFDGINWNIYDTSNCSIPINTLNYFTIDGNDSKWIGTYGNGALKFDGTTWTVYDTSNTPMGYPYVYNIAADPNGNIWATSGSGDTSILKYNGTTWQNIPFNHPGYFSISTIAFDNNGNPYLGTYGQGILKYDGATWTVDTSFASGANSHYIYSLSIDASGFTWALTINYANHQWYILKYDGTSWQGFQILQNSVLASNVILPLLVDDNNNLWAGNAGWNEGGLNKYDGNNWSTFSAPQGFMQLVLALAKDTGNIIWVGTSGGIGGNIYTFDAGVWALKDTISPFGTLDGDVSAIAIDANHNVWAATGMIHVDGSAYGYGLYEYNGTSWNSYPSGLSSHAGTCLAIDASNNKWMGTNGSGLAMYNGSSWISYDMSNSGLPDDTVQCVAIDSTGRIWVGTFHGLAIFDGITWTTYTPANSPLTAEDIEYIAFDHQGLAYIACDGGYVTFDGTTWNVYDMNNSSISNSDIESVVIDQQCNVWLGTECGLDENIGDCATVFKQLSGIVYQSSGVPFANTQVNLLRRNAATNSLNTIEITTTDNSGHYNFLTVDSAVYVHALPSAFFPNQLPVYQDSYLVQQDAGAVNLIAGNPVTKNLTCAALIGITGSGAIDGVIHYPNGTVVKGLRIFLMNISSQPVGTFITDNYGYFAFINLPVGTYNIWVDKLGVDNSLFSGITLTSSSQNQYNLYLVLNPTYLSITTGTEEIETENGLNIFPNPAHSSLRVSFPSFSNQPIELRIYNTLGKQIYVEKEETTKGKFVKEINVEKWSEGIYFLQVKMNEGMINKKFMVQR